MPQVVRIFYQLPTSAGGTGVAEFASSSSSSSNGTGPTPPTVGSLIRHVAQQVGLPCGAVDRLACYRPDGGVALPDSFDLLTMATVEDFDDDDNDEGSVGVCSLRLSWLLPGGKTHGRLGSAGKVRQQTPHVEKAAGRPKCKTGRAKKRQLYNRRFGPADGGGADGGAGGGCCHNRRPNDNGRR